MKTRLTIWLVAPLLLCAAVFAARKTGFMRDVELRALDWRFRALAQSERHDPRFVLVKIDQESLDAFQKDTVAWPWPRSLYAPFVGFCKAAGAKAVVFDLLLTSPSTYGADDDQELAKAAAKAGQVVLAATFRQKSSSEKVTPPERLAVAVEGEPGAAAALKRSVQLPTSKLLPAATAVGDVFAEPDGDGVFRRVPLLSKFDGRYYPTLPLATALAALGVNSVKAGPDYLEVAGRRVPLVDGRMMVLYHGAALAPNLAPGSRTYASYSIFDVVHSFESPKPLVDPAAFKDKIVLLTPTAPGLMDTHPTPISPVSPGTEVVAAAADNIVNGDFLRPVGAVASLLLIILAVYGALSAARFSQGVQAFAWTAGWSLALAGGAAAAFRGGLWLEMAAPQLALWLSFAGASAYGYAVEGAERRYLKRAFSHYLSPEVIAQLIDDPKKLALGGERREITTYFSDIEGFTTISEALPPEKLTHLMSLFLSEMTDTVLDSGGTLDKYIGDAVMAFWNAPAPAADHALRGCKAALENQRKLTILREQLIAEGYPPLRTRIGLNTGMASIGNMGSAARFSYTAIGDSVNLASRLEGANKAYGTYLMISEATKKAAGSSVETRELDIVQVKGKTQGVRVFELLGLAGATDEKRLVKAKLFEQGLTLYRAQSWDEASVIFRRVAAEFGPDKASDVYVERCAHFKIEPPPANWDGSYALTEK